MGLRPELANRIGSGENTLVADGQEIDPIDQRRGRRTVDRHLGDGHEHLDDSLLEAGLLLDLQIFRLRQTDRPRDISQPHQNLVPDFEGLDGHKALHRQIGVLGCYTLRGLAGVVLGAGQAGKPAGVG